VACYQADHSTARMLLEESLEIRRELGDRTGTAYSLACLGAVANHQGDYPTALALQQEGLRIWCEIAHGQGIVGSLEELASVVAAPGNSLAPARI